VQKDLSPPVLRVTRSRPAASAASGTGSSKNIQDKAAKVSKKKRGRNNDVETAEHTQNGAVSEDGQCTLLGVDSAAMPIEKHRFSTACRAPPVPLLTPAMTRVLILCLLLICSSHRKLLVHNPSVTEAVLCKKLSIPLATCTRDSLIDIYLSRIREGGVVNGAGGSGSGKSRGSAATRKPVAKKVASGRAAGGGCKAESKQQMLVSRFQSLRSLVFEADGVHQLPVSCYELIFR